MHTDINEGPEFRYVGNDSFQFHAGLQMFDFADPVGEARGAEFAAGVTSGAGQFLQNIPDCEFSEFAADKVFRSDL